MPQLRADLQFDYSQIGLVALVIGGVILGSGDSFGGALAGRVIGGFGAVFITVPAAKILTNWFVGKKMAAAMSVLGVAWPVGIAVGMSMLPFINVWSGWRVAVYVTATVPALAMILVALLPASGPVQESAAVRSPFWSITRREFWVIVAGGFAWPLMSTGGCVVFSSYAPVMLIDRGLPHTSAALVISILSWLLNLIVLLGGYLADRTGRKDLLFWGGC